MRCQPGECLREPGQPITVMGFTVSDLLKIKDFLRARSLTVDDLASYHFMPRSKTPVALWEVE